MESTRDIKDKVLRHVSIVDTVGRYVKLKKNGTDYFGLCPFHDEKSPSFSVSPAKAFYKCFGCGKTGDVIDFVQSIENKTFAEALLMLADQNNIIAAGYDYKKKKENGKPKGEELPNKPKVVPVNQMLPTLTNYRGNNFYDFLIMLFGIGRATELIARFLIGATEDGGTVFWQIDKAKQIRKAQKIFYKPDGHRDKEKEIIRWFTDREGYSSCFFGEHQLADAAPEDLVCVVESEKTAVICTGAMPLLDGRRCVYLASSGANGITELKAPALTGRDVCLIPDFSYLSRAVWGELPMRHKEINGKRRPAPDGEIDETYLSARQRLLNYKCRVTYLQGFETLENNTDIADVVVSNLLQQAEIHMPDFDLSI